MQIESLLNMGIAPVAETATPVVAPELATQFAGLLEQALTAPPDVPDPGPPLLPINLSIEEAQTELPNATETKPLDLPIETPDEVALIDQDLVESTEGLPPAPAELLALHAMAPFVPTPTTDSPVAEVAASEEAVVTPTVPAVGAPVMEQPAGDDWPAAVPTPEDTPVFAPSAEFAEFDAKPLDVTTGTKPVEQGTQILTTEQIEFLNPTKVDAAAQPDVARHPLTGEPLNPARITMNTGQLTVPVKAAPVAEKAMKSVEEVSDEELVAPTAVTEPAPRKKIAFADRVDMKRAFESGLGETIQRVEVPATTATPQPAKPAAKNAEAKVTVIKGEVAAPEVKRTTDVAAKAGEQTFQLIGTEQPKDVLTTLKRDESESTLKVGEVSAAPREVTTPLTKEATPAKAVVEAKPEPSVDVAKLHQQIVDKAETFLAFRREGALTIHLEPRELGQITMSVKMENGQVRTEIQATNQQVAQSLESNKQQLVQQVESRGLSLGSLNVSTGSHSGNQQGQQQTATHQDFARQQQMARFFAPAASSPVPTFATARGSSAGLDYLI